MQTFFAKYTYGDINDSICFSKFPNELKQAHIVPAHKKSQSFLRKMIYKRCLYDQIATYLEHIFSRCQCDFGKDYSAQHFAGYD